MSDRILTDQEQQQYDSMDAATIRGIYSDYKRLATRLNRAAYSQQYALNAEIDREMMQRHKVYGISYNLWEHIVQEESSNDNN